MELGLVGRYRFGGFSWQVAKCERECCSGDRASSLNIVNTLQVSQVCHCEAKLVKAMSGGGVKASPRCSGENPRVLKTQEGIG